MEKSSVVKYTIAVLVSNILFGMNYSFYSSIIGRVLTSDQLFGLRIISMAVFFVPFMFITGRWKIDFKDLYKLGLISLLIIFGRIYLMLDGMNYTSPIDGSIIATMGPILIMLMSAIFIKEKITLRRTFGILLGAAGAVVLIMSGSKGVHAGKTIGNLLIMASIIFSSFNTVFTKRLISKYDPFTVMGWVYLIGIVVVLPIFGPGMMKIDTVKWTTEMWLELGYIALLGSIVATALSYYGLKGMSATSVSMYAYSQPVIATALAVWRGQDKITDITLISAALIFVGVFVVITSYKKDKAAASGATAKNTTVG